jgi:hypothetical protein
MIHFHLAYSPKEQSHGIWMIGQIEAVLLWKTMVGLSRAFCRAISQCVVMNTLTDPFIDGVP